MRFTEAPPQMASNFGTLTKALVKSSAGRVRSIYAENANAAARYLLLHDKVTAPVATDVPLYAFRIPSSPGYIEIGEEFFGTGLPFANGIGWSISTTKATFTDAATAAEHSLHVHYDMQPNA